jgi:hypothetical protein
VPASKTIEKSGVSEPGGHSRVLKVSTSSFIIEMGAFKACLLPPVYERAGAGGRQTVIEEIYEFIQ